MSQGSDQVRRGQRSAHLGEGGLSFWQYKFYAVIFWGFLKRERQTEELYSQLSHLLFTELCKINNFKIICKSLLLLKVTIQCLMSAVGQKMTGMDSKRAASKRTAIPRWSVSIVELCCCHVVDVVLRGSEIWILITNDTVQLFHRQSQHLPPKFGGKVFCWVNMLFLLLARCVPNVAKRSI